MPEKSGLPFGRRGMPALEAGLRRLAPRDSAARESAARESSVRESAACESAAYALSVSNEIATKLAQRARSKRNVQRNEVISAPRHIRRTTGLDASPIGEREAHGITERAAVLRAVSLHVHEGADRQIR